MIKTILFDIGSTILYEEDIYNALLEKERIILNQKGYNISEDEFSTVLNSSILCRESNPIRSIAWKCTAPDKAACEQIIRLTRGYTDELVKYILVN
ncbi:hypothetical protein [Methanosarcina acetivorans]|uniref:hypothetical protein n=1 Tax=Methanosarcina acetivorans TaxID=2214 RepID=UPI0012FEA27E|nr:hypothetical protein [Methanosarcina acetivorans]